jgi:hypothetical protein
MKIKLLKILFLFIITTHIIAEDFIDGVHIQNKDDKTYIIKFNHYSMTTKICNIKKPTDKIKNGIASVVDRKDKNLKITKKEKEKNFVGDKITAKINKNSNVDCICVRNSYIEVVGIGKKSLKSGSILIIKNGKLIIK